MHFLRRDRDHIQEKMAVLKDKKLKTTWETLLGEAVTGVEGNRDREYTCNDKPTDQTVQSKIKTQQVGGHATNSLNPQAISMGQKQKHH